jgi:hypothetical protein
MPSRTTSPSRTLGRLYAATFGLMALTGFAQMPIFKRYYIADVPGLGWLAQFYVTHVMHYLGAALLLGLIAYAATDFLIHRGRANRLTVSGAIRAILLAGLVATGGLRVVKNFSGVYMSAGWIVFLDLLHLGLVMAYFAVALWALLGKKRWTSAA